MTREQKAITAEAVALAVLCEPDAFSIPEMRQLVMGVENLPGPTSDRFDKAFVDLRSAVMELKGQRSADD